MKLNNINPKAYKLLKAILKDKIIIHNILNRIQAADGQAYLVGGTVRDLLLSKPIADIDIEVHNISFEKLKQLLKKFGIVDFVGKSFRVLKIHGLNVDSSHKNRFIGKKT